MATVSRDELKKTDFLKLSETSGQITKVIAPNDFQVGLDDDGFKSSVTVKGTLIVEQGITGSLTQVSSGVDFLQAGSNISVTKNSNGSLTIEAIGFPTTAALSLGSGLEYDSGTTFDGSVARTLSPNLVNKGGLATPSSAGLRIDFDNLNTDTIETEDIILFGETDNAVAYFPKKCTVSDLLALGSPVTVTNAITLGDGIKDSAGAASSWDNSAAVTIAMDLASNGALNITAGTKQAYVDPNMATVTTTVDLANDYAIIYDADAGATRKVALQYIAGVAPNGLSLGDGLTPYGTAYDGSVGVTAAVLPADSTVSSTSSGIRVLKVPYALTDGAGIQTFSYDGGTAAVAVAIDRNTAGGLNFNGSNEIQLDINNLSAGSTPSIVDEIAVSFGSNSTKKVDIGLIGSVVTADFKSSGSFNVPVASKFVTTASISFAGTQGFTHTSDTGREDTYFYVSGSIGKKDATTPSIATFGGDVFVSGSLISPSLSGSLTMLPDGTSYLVAGSNVEIVSSSNGSITISSTGGGGGAALTILSGSTSVSSVDTINVSELGVLQSLGSGDVAITASIGSAEDGSYSDGLFTDFTTKTPVGTAVDRFNEVLKGLAPSAAPSLDDANCNDSGTSANLSFGSSQSISLYTNAQPSTLTPTDNLSDVNINGTFSTTTVSNDTRRACFKTVPTIDGTLNADVSADSPNYAADSFGDGDQGTLKLYVNNNSTEIHSVDLSSFGSGNSLNGDGSGFNLIAATPGHFSDGSNFETFQHRQGTYKIVSASQRDGWNYARITHTVGSSITTTNYIEWVIDPNDVALSAAGSAMDVPSMTGTKNLSGVKYNTGGSTEYRIRVSNAYRNTYSTSNITYNGTNCSVPNTTFPIIDYGAGENEEKVLHLTGSVTITGDPILDGSITVSTNVPHPLKSNLSSGGSQSISGLLLYDLSDTSTVTSETFRGESYRLISGSYNAQSDVTNVANAWDSTTSLTGVDGLLFYNSRLYPPVQGGDAGDFRNTADGGSITNGPSSNVDYSGETAGTRTFYRKFQNNSGGSKTNFELTINGSGTIVSHSTSLTASTSNLHVFIKLPLTSDPFSTGWMDLATAFSTGQTSDGSGCLVGSLDSSLNATNEVTFGTESAGDDDYVMVLIKTDATFTGYISNMSVSWS